MAMRSAAQRFALMLYAATVIVGTAAQGPSDTTISAGADGEEELMRAVRNIDAPAALSTGGGGGPGGGGGEGEEGGESGSDGSESCLPSNLAVVDGEPMLYECSFAIASDVTMHWRVRYGHTNRVDLAIEGQGTDGWIALAFPTRAGVMVPADAFVATGNGEDALGREPSVKVYGLKGKSPEQISLYPASTAMESNSATLSNGKLVLRIDDVNVLTEEIVELLFARHTSGTFPANFDCSTSNGFQINFERGYTSKAAIAGEDPVDLKVRIHAMLQIISWAFLVPLAILIKRFGGGKVKVCGYPLPSVVHMVLIVLAVLLSLAGTVLAKVEFPHRTKFYHGIAGLVVTILVVLQAVLALIRGSGPKTNKIGAQITVVFAMITMYLGMRNYSALWDHHQAIKLGVLACQGVFGFGVLPYYILLIFEWVTGGNAKRSDQEEHESRRKSRKSKHVEHGEMQGRTIKPDPPVKGTGAPVKGKGKGTPPGMDDPGAPLAPVQRKDSTSSSESVASDVGGVATHGVKPYKHRHASLAKANSESEPEDGWF